VTLIIAASAAIGSLGGLNQTDAKIILTYSSIAHSAWILAVCASSSLTSWGVYFTIYAVISISIIVPLYKININSINQIIIFKQNNLTKISLLVRVLSLGGLPPFLGFLAKLGAIQLIISNIRIILAIILITASLISLYYYIRVIYFLVLKTRKINLISEEHNQPVSYLIATISLGGNITAPLVVLLT
jgi:NADH:ubiquinone oxidoreductase subunit 2 (subunit N)